MSDFPLPVLFIMAVFFSMWMIMRVFHKHEKAKRALPALDVYLQAHGQAEPSCHACGAVELKEEGLSHGKDSQRFVSCAKCKALLYRFERPQAAEEAVPVDAHWRPLDSAERRE
ncbi:hypothetical protein ACFQ4M_13565 [Thauera mechernichensis]|uniref:Uncharacterized protein n=1 Tax=Thauera mechernichensis TaxID=82788 RepID=A0ABW3WI33_9RHOO|nr:hypothetical protein [Thauera mechernichensis]MDG3064787.1 hypothetical protein [Thauera mechernichensis]